MSNIVQKKKVAAFGLGYSLSFLNCLLDNDDHTSKNIILVNALSVVESFRSNFEILFEENFEISDEYRPNTKLSELITNLFYITEQKVSDYCDQNIAVYFYAGSLLSLSNFTSIVFDDKKFKLIFYEVMNELGSKISWVELSRLTSQLKGSDKNLKRNARNEILDCIYSGSFANSESLQIYNYENIFNIGLS